MSFRIQHPFNGKQQQGKTKCHGLLPCNDINRIDFCGKSAGQYDIQGGDHGSRRACRGVFTRLIKIKNQSNTTLAISCITNKKTGGNESNTLFDITVAEPQHNAAKVAKTTPDEKVSRNDLFI